MNAMAAPIVVLLSGRGSNLKAILDAVQRGELPVSVRAVISNNPQAGGLGFASTAGITTEIIDHRGFPDRTTFDRALMNAIDKHQPVLVVLAGFMRILGSEFIQHYTGRLINIHPSLLPAFKGLNTHAQALAAGAHEHGASVHFVTNDLDGGPVIAQTRVPVKTDDTEATLSARVLAAEHQLYPKAIQWFVEQRLTIRNGHVLLDGASRPEQELTEKNRIAEAS